MSRKNIRTYKTCDICSKGISLPNYSRHYDKCSGVRKLKHKPKSEKWLAAMAARRGKGTNQYTKAIELGLPKPQISEETRKKLSIASSRRAPFSEETKRKISESRIRFLRENPHMVPYRLNHYSKGRSYPEEYWKNILDSNNLQYEEQYQIGPYQLDFAFLKSKIDLEIDGDQHYLDPRIVNSDKRRNEYLTDLGWTTIRIKWSEYKKLQNKEEFIKEILKRIHGEMGITGNF